MADFKILSLYYSKSAYMLRDKYVHCLAVCEVFLPVGGITIRDVKISIAHKKVRLHLPHTDRDGLLSFQIGDKALLEAVRQEVARLLPSAPVLEEVYRDAA